MVAITRASEKLLIILAIIILRKIFKPNCQALIYCIRNLLQGIQIW